MVLALCTRNVVIKEDIFLNVVSHEHKRQMSKNYFDLANLRKLYRKKLALTLK